jgi:methylglutaconyl-CoA hydratase
MALVNSHIENRVAYVNLNRPKKRNALNSELVIELKHVLKGLESNDDCKVIILSGEGEAFCAGADLEYLETLQKNTFEENLEDSNSLKELFEIIYQHKKVIIAKLTGHAIAGGAGLATVCDLVYAVPECKLGYTEVRIGFIPAIVASFLLRKVGEAAAKELLLVGHLISADEALKMGMINGVIEEKDIHEIVKLKAEEICTRCSGSSLTSTKALINMVQDHTISDALNKAAEMNANSRATADCQAGISAFLNKEKKVW